MIRVITTDVHAIFLRPKISRIFSDLTAGGYVGKENGRLVIMRKPPPRW